MPFFGNRRRDFSIQPPRQQVDGTPFFVTDSANIDFTLNNLNLTADLTFTGVTAGTYGDATHIPILQIDQWGRVTGVTLTTFSASGILLETNSTANTSQTILNLTSGTDIQVVDLGGGVIKFNYTGSSGNTYTVNNGLSAQTVPSANPNNFQLGGATLGTGNLVRDTYITNDGYVLRIDQINPSTSALDLTHSGTGLNTGKGLTSQAGGIAVRANSSESWAFEGVSALDYTAALLRNASSTNDVVGLIKLVRDTSGTPFGGIGGSIDFWIETRQTIPAPLPTDPTVRLAGIWEVPGPAVLSRLSRFDIYGYSNGGALLNASIRGDGAFSLYQYGINTFAGTPAYALGVDAVGNVVEFTPSTGTVTSVSTGTGLTGGPITTTGTISLNSKLAPADNLTGNALKYLRVNAGETAVEYATASSSGGILHGTAAGTDTYTVTITGATAYADGDAYLIRFTNGNTTGCTLNINGQGAVPLYRNNDGPLIGGDILSGAEMLCIYNSTTNRFQVIGTSPNTLLSYVTNDDTVTLTKGMAVFAFSGTGDRMTVQRASNLSDSTSAQTVGLVLSSSIAPNQKGIIMMQGLLDGLNILPTATWSDGDPVFLGDTPGSITPTKPYAPKHLVYLGVVTTANNGSAGRMYVKVQNGYELDEIHDVALKAPYQVPVNNDVLTYITGSPKNMWQARSIGTILGGTTSQYVRGDGSLATFPTIPTVTPSALTKVDDTNVTLTLGGTPSTALLQPSSLTLGWTGQLSTSRGGTGLSTIGTSTQYLRVNVPGTALEYATFPVVPSPVSVFPYQRTNYYKPSDNRDLEYYNNNLFMVNNGGNNVQVVNSQTTLTTVTTGGLSSPNQSSVITDLATPEVWVTGNVGAITRHNANTGAFIANTTPTGSVTTAASTRYVSYSATKSIGGNGTNIFTINPATFVTANLAAHGIGAIIPHLDVNKNPSSAQNDHVMMGGPNGIILFNCNTNAIVLAATTLAGAIGPVYDIKYDPSNNNWIVVCTISGVIKIVYLRPLTATTFSIIKTIDTYSIFGNTLTPGNTQNIKIDFDTTYQYLFVMSYSRLYMYDLSNGDLLKTLNAIMLTGGNIQSASAIDTANKRLFFCTGGAGNTITYEYVYA